MPEIITGSVRLFYEDGGAGPAVLLSHSRGVRENAVPAWRSRVSLRLPPGKEG